MVCGRSEDLTLSDLVTDDFILATFRKLILLETDASLKGIFQDVKDLKKKDESVAEKFHSSTGDIEIEG